MCRVICGIIHVIKHVLSVVIDVIRNKCGATGVSVALGTTKVGYSGGSPRYPGPSKALFNHRLGLLKQSSDAAKTLQRKSNNMLQCN